MALDAFASVLPAAEALEASALGRGMRGGSWYSIANVAHILGLVMLVGGIGVLDLRIVGFGRQIPIAPLSRLLTPIALMGLATMAGSGFFLFAADAGPLVINGTFQLKLGLVAVALANALLFRRSFREFRGEPALAARALALVSLGLWLIIASLGRLIAYT